MKKILFGCAILACGFIMPQAIAQDYCCSQYDPCCCQNDFNGLYIGGNLGVITHLSHRNDLDGFYRSDTTTGWSYNNTDFTIGLQVGYDWQCCNKLFGLVVDWNWVNVDNKIHHLTNTSASYYYKDNFDWFTTIRARAGLTVCDALLYVTLGAAVTSHDTKWYNAGFGSKCFDHTKWGWTGGVGAEFLVWCNWSVGAEVLYMHFDNRNKSYTVSGTTPTRYRFSHSDSAWIGRFIVNYRFGDLCCW